MSVQSYLANMVSETTVTQGTGSYNLEGPAAGFRSFRSQFATGTSCAYVCQQIQYNGEGNVTGIYFEVGLGTLTHGSPDTIARTQILDSTNGGSAVDWGEGTKTIWSAAPASLSVLMDTALTAGQAGKGLVVNAGSTGFELAGPFLPLAGGIIAGLLEIVLDGLPLALRRSENDTALREILRLKRGDNSGTKDVVIQARGDEAHGIDYLRLNFADGGPNFDWDRANNAFILPADGTSPNHAVRKGQVDAAILSGPHVAAAYSNLRVSRTGNAGIDIDASYLTVFDSGGNGRGLRNVDLSVAITGSGVNGLDTGSEASNTWYYGYVIFNPTTSTIAGLLSTSPTAPTLPSGYTFSRLVTAVRNDGSSNFVDYIQRNEQVQYRGGALPEISSGSEGTIDGASPGGWATKSVAAYVPTAIASEIDVQAWATGNNSRIVMAPNTSYTPAPTGTNAPPIGGGGTSGAANFSGNIACGRFLLEDANVYVAATTNTKSACRGFSINL